MPSILSALSLLSEFHEFDFMVLAKIEGFTVTSHKSGTRIDKIARNLVDYEAGKTILDTVMGIVKKQNEKQIELF